MNLDLASKMFSRNDAELIEAILDYILRITMSNTNLHVAPCPVGVSSRARELRLLLKLELNDHEVHIVGLCGMAGIGKTTIAKALYNIGPQFGSNRSFLENVRQILDQPHVGYVCRNNSYLIS